MKKIKNLWLKTIYLGYDKQTIERSRLKMNEDNIRVAGWVSLLLICILGILLLFYSLYDNQPIRNGICAVSALIMAGVFGASRHILKDKPDCVGPKTDLLIDLISYICFFIAIYLGTFAAGDEMAVAPVWMFFFAILIFNRLPIQNLLVLSVAFVVFVLCSHMTKSSQIFRYDMMHAITSIVASLSMSWGKSKMKVENVLAFERLQSVNLEILETVEEQEKEAQLLRHKANRDELTGFYKKDIFEEKVREILNTSGVKVGHALACVDIDDFKGVNDTLGHLFGDRVLKNIAQILEDQAEEATVFCRFGGDEFCVFFPDIESREKVEDYVMRVMSKVGANYRHGKICKKVFLSMGIALSQGMGTSYEELFQSADDALYRSKAAGKNTYRFAEEALSEVSSDN